MATVGMVRPELLGIKSHRGKQAYRVGRGIDLAAGALGAGALAGGASAVGAGGMGGGGFSGLLTGAAKSLLPGMAKQFLGGGQGGGDLSSLAGLYGAYQGYKGQEGALSDLAGMESRYTGLLSKQEQLAGLDPNVAAQMKRQAQQGLRAAQAERGIYESGVSAAQEAELMPRIEQSQRSWQLQQLAGITPQYGIPMESAGRRAGMFGTGQEAGQALAGMGGGGSDILSGLAGKAWGGLSGLFGGGSPQYGEEDYSGIPSWMTGRG